MVKEETPYRTLAYIFKSMLTKRELYVQVQVLKLTEYVCMTLQICSCARSEREGIPALTCLSPKLLRYTSRMHMAVGSTSFCSEPSCYETIHRAGSH